MPRSSPAWAGTVGLLAAMAYAAGNLVMVGTLIVLGVLIMVTAFAATSAAYVIFKALLYNHATGRSVPANVDQSLFNEAFRTKKS